MRQTVRRTKPTTRLVCEALEDRTTPAVGFALTGAAAGAASLLTFETSAPGTTTSTTITGLDPADILVGIDFRPQNGQLYGLGVSPADNDATLYAISARTGVATSIGAPGSIVFQDAMGARVPLPDPATVGYGFDFNPTVDRIRVVAGQLNFRLNPNTGTAVDGNLGGMAAVANVNTDGNITGATTALDGSAYTNNVPNAPAGSTTLFGIDGLTGALYVQTDPNGGVTQVRGPLGVTFTRINGFDISANGDAFAVLTVAGVTRLYTVNLTNGAAAPVNTVGTGMAAVQGFAVQSDVAGTPAIALSADGTQLLRFNSATPATVTTATFPAAGAMNGIAMGETLVAIDVRPQTGQLYGLGVNATADTATLYVIDPQNATATAVGTAGGIAFVAANGGAVIDLPPATAGYGIDFNPTVDRLRVTTGTGLNFRLNPNNPMTGVAVDSDTVANGTNPDTAISGAGVTGVVATAYTNSFGQSLTGGTTTQYTLDAVSNALYIQGATAPGPNGGVQSGAQPITVGGQPLDFDAVTGFDIPGGVRVTTSGTSAAGFGFATMVVGGTTRLYSINLANGQATVLGAVGTGSTALGGLAVADTSGGTVGFQAATATGAEGTSAMITLTRTGGTGPQTVTVTATAPTMGNAATPGTDFTAGPFTVTFPDGANTVTFPIPLLTDGATEPAETVTLTITAASNGLIGAATTATLTITDVAPVSPPVVPPTVPPTSPPVATGATVSGSNVVINKAGGGTATFAFAGTGLTPMSATTTDDFNGGGGRDVAVMTVNAVGKPVLVVLDGVTNSPYAVFGDLTGDGLNDLVLQLPSFNASIGAPANTFLFIDGRTGRITRLG